MTLKRGSTGADVTWWQAFLHDSGFPLIVDGTFGVQTEDATKAFQREHGLTADGIVGPATLKLSNPPSSGGTTLPGRVMPAARLSGAGRALIKGFEGLRLVAYPDGKNPDGSPRYSVGYGHNGVQKGTTITRTEADRYFDQDVARFEKAVASATPQAAQHEFDAMCSLAYNIGTDEFRRSTVARRHNGGDTQGAADAFEWFNKSDGEINPVLKARRELERTIYLHGHGGGGGAAPAPSGGGNAVAVVAALVGGVVVFSVLRR
jgi:lysozyme